MLNDPEKRRLYDKYGFDGLKEGRDPYDRKGGKGEDMMIPVDVSLEDLYQGLTHPVAIKRDVVCPRCKGSGSKTGKEPRRCEACDGRGFVLFVRRAGFFVQQAQSVCPDCKGAGHVVDASDRCPVCRGAQVVPEEKTLEVKVERGMKDDQTIRLEGMANQRPDMRAGDVVFVVRTAKHPVFTRIGDDLYTKRTISLVEALTGFSFEMTHLDGRRVTVRSPPGRVVAHGDKLVVREGGMPVYNRPFCFGDLFIKFHVAMPEWEDISAGAQNLRDILPNTRRHTQRPGSDDDDDDESDEKRRGDDEDEDEDGKGEVVEIMFSEQNSQPGQRYRSEGGDDGNSYDEDEDEGYGGQQGAYFTTGGGENVCHTQ